MKPGIYPGLTMAEYIALPALSAGVIRTTVDRCPAAARFESWLNPRRPADDTDASDVGTIAHAILLEGSEDCCQVFDPADYPNAKGGGVATGWTNKAIQEARGAARSAGKIPILIDDIREIRDLVAAARAFIDSLRDTEPAVWRAFQPDGGQSEVTFVWQEGETLCKSRADRIANTNDVIIDYKSSAMSVEPDRWGRTQLVNMGYYVSAAWYCRGVRALTGVNPTYLFLCGETAPPHLHSIVGCDPETLALGDEKVGAGLRLWQQCVRTNTWPAYANRVVYPALPVYERMRWDERNGIGEDGIPYDISKLFERKESV